LVVVTIAALFVAVAVLWAWAFVMKPFKEIPFAVRMGLTIAMFGQTSFGAWVVLKRGVWRPAMIAALLISGIATAICLTAYWFEGVEFAHPYPPGPPAKFTLYDAAYLLATWAVALPWAGLLSLSQLTGWAQRIRQIAIAAVWLLALVPEFAWLMDLSGTLHFGSAILLIGLAFSSGSLAVLGTIAVTILSVRADRGTQFPELHTLSRTLIGQLKESPLRNLLRFTFHLVSFCFAGYLALLAFGFAYNTHLVLDLRGPPKTFHLPIFFGIIALVLLILIGLTLWIHRWHRPWTGLTLGIVVGLSWPALRMIWKFIFALLALS